MSSWRITYNDGRGTVDVSNVSALNLVNGTFVFDAQDAETGANYTGRVEPGDLLKSVVRLDPTPASSTHSIDVWWRVLPILGGLITGTPDRYAASGAWPVDSNWLALFDDYGAVRYFRTMDLRTLKLV